MGKKCYICGQITLFGNRRICDDCLKIREELRKEERDKKINDIEKRLKELCKKYNFDIDRLKSRHRYKNLVDNRRKVSKILFDEGFLLKYIAISLNRDHTTISNLLK